VVYVLHSSAGDMVWCLRGPRSQFGSGSRHQLQSRPLCPVDQASKRPELRFYFIGRGARSGMAQFGQEIVRNCEIMRLDAEVDAPLRTGVEAADVVQADVPVIFRACEVHEPEC
jgi:hypothetical protein